MLLWMIIATRITLHLRMINNMGGVMTWPRFRSRNNLLLRPNYYTGAREHWDSATGASGKVISPPAKVGFDYFNEPSDISHARYLSGEIDRMVYGWWKSPAFLRGVSDQTGVSVSNVLSVVDAMLSMDYEGDERSEEWP